MTIAANIESARKGVGADLRGLIVYRASRLEALLPPLLALLDAAPPARVLAPHEIIAAHPGMQKWLSRELALARGTRGIAANLRIELPSTWLDRLALALLGEEAVALRPYRRDVLRWRIHEVIGTLGDARVAAYFDADGGSRAQRRFQLADRLARIYTRYLVYRPDWLRDWAAGRGAHSDHLLATLWKTLHRQIGLPHRGEMLARLIASLDAGADQTLGDDPLHVFGLAHLAPSELDVLRAVARRRPVVLYVPDPCREFWGGLRAEREHLRDLVRRSPDAAETESAFLDQGHPLLASWGRMGQHFLLALDDAQARIDERHWQDVRDTAQLDSRLHRMQESLRQLDPALIGETGDAAVDRADRSLRVHACHTRLRELEVLRDVLLRERKEDAKLKPSDIVVMMPDIGAYLPLLPTVFGEAGKHAGPLPYHCFDVAIARAHPLFAAFRQLLDLPQSRVTAPEVVDLLAAPQIARRLGLGSGDVDVLTRWLQNSRAAWALDAAFRTRFDVPAIAEHTFGWAMDRMLAGYVVGPGGDTTSAIELADGGRIVPLEGVHGPEAALLGALDTLLVELNAWCAAAATPRAASAWATWFEQRVEALFAVDPADREAREARAFVLRFVRTIADEPAASDLDPQLDFSVVREVLLARLDAVPEQQRFLLGGVTFCGMVPQRAIPFEVVAVLGLNDGEFPRGGSDGGLDLMTTQRRLGDRDARSDDRYLFLETLMSARRVLHLSYIGEGVRDGKPRNPAAPLAELMEALDAAAGAGDDDTPLDADDRDGERERRPWFVRHPLQPFDPRYFDRGDGALFSFNAAFATMRGDPRNPAAPAPFLARAAARADSNPAGSDLADSKSDRTDLAPPGAIELREVIAYFKDPARQVLAGTLNLRLDAVDESRLRDSEALEPRVEAIDQVAKRLFTDAVARAGLQLPESPPDWLRLTGVLPPGRAGMDAWNDELRQARALVDAAATHELFAHGLPRARPLRIEHAIELGGGEALLRGELRRVYEKGDALWVMECYPGRDAESKLDFKPRIGFFLEWALVRLSQPSPQPVHACIVIAGEYDGWQRSFDAWNARFAHAGGRDAPDMLDDLERRVAALVAFWRRAQRDPPWYLPATSWAAAQSIDKAREKWLGSRGVRAERDYAPGYARLLLGDRDFSDGEDIAALHAAALQLRVLIDLNHPLADAP